jgi:hypothetical protein
MRKVACLASVMLVGVPGCVRRSPHDEWLRLLPDGATRDDVIVVRNGDTLGYSGELTPDGFERLKKADAPVVRTLLIRSGGGEIGNAMDVGTWVHERGLEVRVVEYCVSSCANYVFVAGKTKRILPGGTVAWHGNALQRGMSEQIGSSVADPLARAKTLEYLEQMKSKQARFYEVLGVNECICRVGTDAIGKGGLYSMSKTDMQRFGVTNVLEAPLKEQDIDESVRRGLDLRFVQVPPGIESTTCEHR